MPNRLAKEKSPYLLQHQHNPVDWYPWGDEAFEEAKKQNKPIFLSIGYATCHWCHVMEHESFEDDDIAKMMNEAFINVKVDREERPDIDATYMTVCQLINGQGGWPLSIVMNAEKEPFFASTYIPKEARFNRIGMRQLIPGVLGMWENEPERISKAVEQIKKGFSQSQEFTSGRFPGTEAIDFAAEQLMQNFDQHHGGFGGAPKFPSPHNLMFLLRQFHHTKDQRFLDAVHKTLIEMRCGGLWDHVGFGFHRYSTDAEWLLPHFEKMLYDQALMMMAYTEGWQLTKNPLFKQTVYEIAEYVMRDLTSEDGAFYSAEDADSEGEEGKFYVWEADELRETLLKNYHFVEQHFGVDDEGNFEVEATRKKTRQNILHLNQPLEPTKTKTWEEIRNKLFEDRSGRIRPLLDDKVLTDWNALMIAALAKAGAVFQDQELILYAEKAFGFIQENLFLDQDLMHRYKDGEAAIMAFSDDYLNVIWASLELYQASFNPDYLELAITHMDSVISRFWDPENGGFFLTPEHSDQPLGLQKQIYDGAIPSANSVGLFCLTRLGRITGNKVYEDKAQNIGEFFSADLIRNGSSISMGMIALQFLHHNSGEIVVAAGDQDSKQIKEFLQTEFLPSKIILWKEAEMPLDSISPFTKVQNPKNGYTQIYSCKNYSCDQPVGNVEDLITLLS